MKMIKYVTEIIGCLFFTLTFNNTLIAQPPDNCWSGDPCTADWICESHSFDYQLLTIGLIGTVKYCWRNCGGEIEIIIDWDYTELIDPDFLAHGTKEELDFDGAREYLKLLILNKVIDLGNITIPDCSTGGKTFFNIYTARCGVWVKCSYKVDTQGEVMKDIGYDGNCPLPYSHNGDSYIDVWKWQSCGEVCCKKTYTVCKEGTTGAGNIRISTPTTDPAPGEQCTDQGVFKDWKTDLPYQCKDGCAGSGN